MRRIRLLVVTRAHLLQVRVEQLGLLGAGPPDVHPLRPDVHVDPLEVPVEQALDRPGRQHRLRGGQLLHGLARVALAVRIEVAVVDRPGPLDENGGRIAHAGARGVGEEQRDLGVRGRVVGLFRIAKAGGDVDALGAGLVVRRHRPGDGLPAPVDRRVLGRDEPVEDLLDVLRQRAGHAPQFTPVTASAQGAQPGCAHMPAWAARAWAAAARNVGASWSFGWIVSGSA